MEKRSAPMIKLSYKVLNSKDFNESLAMLTTQKGFTSFAVAYNIAKISKKFAEELATARQMYATWTKEFFATDESGKFKMAENPHPLCPFELKEGVKEEFEKKLSEFMNTEIKIDAKPLKPEEMGEVNLSPMEVLALEPLFEISQK